jgi:membrane protein DedA with SNARE-associated domain
LRWLLAAAAVLTATATAGAALMPPLLAYSPLLLIGLSPLPRHLVMAAPLVPIVPFVLVATTRRMLTSALAYSIGHAYGKGGITWAQTRYPILHVPLDMLQKAFDVAAPLVIFLAPGAPIAALAGAVRVPLWLFLPIAAAGQAMWAALTYRVGEALGAWLAPILQFVKDNVASTTLVCVVLVGGYALWRRRARKRVLRELDAQVGSEERSSLTPAASTSTSDG